MFQHNEMYVATRMRLESGIIRTLIHFFPDFTFFSLVIGFLRIVQI